MTNVNAQSGRFESSNFDRGIDSYFTRIRDALVIISLSSWSYLNPRSDSRKKEFTDNKCKSAFANVVDSPDVSFAGRRGPCVHMNKRSNEMN